MNGRALLIGCETGELAGVGHDLALMDRALRTRGFTVRPISGPEATRAGILTAYRQLIESAEPGEPAVVYYSGHGGRVQAPPPDTPGPSAMDLQFIVPADIGESSPGDFRGITSVELSTLLARLVERTGNATVILDCCHAAYLSRRNPDLSARVRAQAEPVRYELLRTHVEKLRASGELPAAPLPVLGNRQAVRIVACAAWQSAFEYLGEDDKPVGVLTESLALALTEADTERVSWATVMERVRRRVLTLFPSQRPEAEGASRRVLFETEPDDDGESFRTTELEDGRARIPCAALLGVQIGDTFEITAPAPSGAAREVQIGTVRVNRVSSFSADGPVRFEPGWSALPLGARARRTMAVAPAMPVALPGSQDPRAAVLRGAIDAAPQLRPAYPGEPCPAEVRIGDDGLLTIHDRYGRLSGAYPPDDFGAAAVCRGLDALARVLALRALAGGSSWSLNAAIAIEWGRVREGVPREPLPVSGATAHTGDRVYIDVENRSVDDVYLSLIDIGLSGRITILTDDAPSGRRLAPGQRYVLGYDALDGRLPGIPLSWPEGLDPALARPETVLLLVSEAPQDVSVLGQRGVRRDRRRADRDSPLAGLLSQAAGEREFILPHRDEPVVRYDARTIEFDLCHAPRVTTPA